MDEPEYGYGKWRRPLWSVRDRDAEAIRQVLRRAGFDDLDERHVNGFAVEGTRGAEADPYFVSDCGRDTERTMRRFRRALEQAGLRVQADVDDDAVLLVTVPPGRTVQLGGVARSSRAWRRIMVVCLVLAAGALVVSWSATGLVHEVGGVGSGVLGLLALLAAGLLYRSRRYELQY